MVPFAIMYSDLIDQFYTVTPEYVFAATPATVNHLRVDWVIITTEEAV